MFPKTTGKNRIAIANEASGAESIARRREEEARSIRESIERRREVWRLIDQRNRDRRG